MKEKLTYTINNEEYLLMQFEIVFYEFDKVNKTLLDLKCILNSQQEVEKKGFLVNKAYLLKYLVPIKYIRMYNKIIQGYL